MRVLDAGLQAALDAGATTMCRCWRLERRDGAVLGFTDHDEDLVFAGVTYAAATGMTASAVSASIGLAVEGCEVAGALDSDALDADDLRRGRYDGAEIVLYLVDWTNTARFTILMAGTLGEVSRGETAFSAELRSLAWALNQPQGRLYQRLCDADLGDARCGVDIGDYTESGTVIRAPDPATIVASGLGSVTEGRLERGLLTWTSGANDGTSIEVKTHLKHNDQARLELVEGMTDPIAEGDTFDVTFGCPKTFRACRRIFDNAVNFRGFPHMPGNDYIMAPAKRGEDNDGRALVRDRED